MGFPMIDEADILKFDQATQAAIRTAIDRLTKSGRDVRDLVLTSEGKVLYSRELETERLDLEHFGKK